MRAPQRPRHRRRGSLRIGPLPLLLAAALAVIATIWAGPRLLDWNAHREAIEAAASGFLGRDVEISGPIRLSLLPQPSITAERVDVRDDGDGVRMSARALTLNLSLGSLLTGRVAITHVVLDRPDIRLPWPLPHGPISIEPPPWLAALSADVSHGSLRIGPLSVTDADLAIVTGGAGAALRIDGQGNVDGVSAGGGVWQVGIALAWPQADGGAPLQVTLQNTATPASTFGFKGMMTARGDVLGGFTAHGDDIAALVPAPALPFDATGTLRANGRGVSLTDLALTLGTMPASGEVRLRLAETARAWPGRAATAAPALTIHLHTPMLDLAPWLSAFPADSLKTAPLSLDLDADSAVLGGGLLRGFGLKLVTSARRIRVDALHATLPGEAALTLDGSYDPTATAFVGHMSLGVPSPAITLHWLAQSKLLPDYSGALSGLTSLAITAAIIADPRHAALTGIAGRMNETTIAGTLALGLGTAPSVGAGLAFGRIDLGQWIPPDWLEDPPRPDQLAHSLSGITADLRLSAAEVWLGAERVDRVVLDAAIGGGGLNLRQLAGQDQGMQLLASGAMDRSGVVSSARLVLAAAHASPLVALLPPRLRGAHSVWDEPLAATLTAAGPPDAVAVSLQGSLGDLLVSAQPVLDLVHDHWAGAVTLQHPSAPRLLRALGYGDAASWLGEGSLSVVAEAASDGSSWTLAPVTFSLGMLHGSGSLRRAAARPLAARRITGTLMIDSLPWPGTSADDPIPIGLLQGWNATIGVTVNRVMDNLSPGARDVHAEAQVDDGVLRIALGRATLLASPLTGMVSGQVTGTLSLAATDPPVMTAALDLSAAAASPAARKAGPGTPLSNTPLALAASRLAGHATLTARGYSLTAWLASLDAELSLTAGPGVLTGIDLAAISRGGPGEPPPAPGATSVFTGSTAFDTLAATAGIAQGELHLGGFRLSGAAGVMTATGQVDLVRGICNLDLALKPDRGTSVLGAALRGPLSHPGAWIVHGTAMN